MYKPKYFKLKELVPEGVWKDWGEKAWWFLDPRLLKTIDKVREHFNKPMLVNNYSLGLRERGFRLPYTTTGVVLSQHKFGRAVDFNIIGLNNSEVQKNLTNNIDKFEHLNFILERDNYTHIDIRADV